MQKVRNYKCPICHAKYKQGGALIAHTIKEHEGSIPDDWSDLRYLYYVVTGKKEGHCVECGNETEWNEDSGKYNRFCNNPKCKAKYKEEFKKRMMDKHGKIYLMKDPEFQRKLLQEHHHLRKEYIFTDGTKISCIGSYEYSFLEYIDKVLGYTSSDIMAPSPHTYVYQYEGKDHYYIPDFYIPSLNLEIEIKDGGDNPNMHSKIVAVDKVKESLKDEVMAKNPNIDYLKIVNKENEIFFQYLVEAKQKILNNDTQK